MAGWDKHRWRKRVVDYGREQQGAGSETVEEPDESSKDPSRYIEWAALLKRTFDSRGWMGV